MKSAIIKLPQAIEAREKDIIDAAVLLKLCDTLKIFPFSGLSATLL